MARWVRQCALKASLENTGLFESFCLLNLAGRFQVDLERVRLFSQPESGMKMSISENAGRSLSQFETCVARQSPSFTPTVV